MQTDALTAPPGQPLFLGIGVQKGGTTWLHNNLRKHRDVWLPPIKEVHYFDRSRRYPSQSQLSYISFPERMLRKPSRRFFCDDYKWGHRQLMRGNWFNYLWVWRYHLLRPSDQYYLKLMRHPRVKYTAEVTPSYSILSREDIACVKQLLPDTKIILYLRDPVERAWSQLKFNLKGHSLEEANLDVAEWIQSPSQRLRGDYPTILENWESIYSSDQLMINFFENIQNEPEALMDRTCAFLGLDRNGFSADLDLSKRENVGNRKPIPAEIHQMLAEFYLPSLRQLAQRFGEPCTAWLGKAEAVVG